MRRQQGFVVRAKGYPSTHLVQPKNTSPLPDLRDLLVQRGPVHTYDHKYLQKRTIWIYLLPLLKVHPKARSAKNSSTLIIRLRQVKRATFKAGSIFVYFFQICDKTYTWGFAALHASSSCSWYRREESVLHIPLVFLAGFFKRGNQFLRCC